MKNVKIVSFVVLILILIAGALYYQKTDSAQITIGAILPLTGRAAYLGEPDQAAMRLAEKEINQAYPGKKVRLIVEDSQSDTDPDPIYLTLGRSY